MRLARIALAVAGWLATTDCASLPTGRDAGLLTISIEGEAHEIQTFKPIRPKPAKRVAGRELPDDCSWTTMAIWLKAIRARPFLIIRASDVAVLRPPGSYRLHVIPGSAARNYLVLALGHQGDRTVSDVLTLAPHSDRLSAGPYSMEERWEWHFYAIADDGRLHSHCGTIQ